MQGRTQSKADKPKETLENSGYAQRGVKESANARNVVRLRSNSFRYDAEKRIQKLILGGTGKCLR
jgi:hypothetical protein